MLHSSSRESQITRQESRRLQDQYRNQQEVYFIAFLQKDHSHDKASNLLFMLTAFFINNARRFSGTPFPVNTMIIISSFVSLLHFLYLETCKGNLPNHQGHKQGNHAKEAILEDDPETKIVSLSFLSQIVCKRFFSQFL